MGAPDQLTKDPEIERWKAAEKYCLKMLRKDPTFDIPDHYLKERLGWIEMIKTIRSALGASLDEAHVVAMRHRGWRKWASKRVETDRQCAKNGRLAARYPELWPYMRYDEGKFWFAP